MWMKVNELQPFVRDHTEDNVSLMCLSSLQALPYVALLIVMLFFIYAVIGMQVSSWLVPSLCLVFFSLHLSFSKALVLCLSSRSLVPQSSCSVPTSFSPPTFSPLVQTSFLSVSVSRLPVSRLFFLSSTSCCVVYVTDDAGETLWFDLLGTAGL